MPKRIVFAVAFLVALALPAAAVAQSLAFRYERDYHAVAAKYGPRAPGRDILRQGLSTGGPASPAALSRSISVLERMLGIVPARVLHRTAYHAAAVDGDGDHDGDTSDAAAAAPSAPARTATIRVAPRRVVQAPRHVYAPVQHTAVSGGGYGSISGVPSNFAACVAMRESGNGAASANVYGIIPASGYNVAGMSVAQQKQVFSRIYHTVGASAWSRYDGC